ncbi:MAG: glutamyl-tRNA synthetase [Saprospiraceae bacterium]|jgi:glutamyl-tRNA synthetase
MPVITRFPPSPTGSLHIGGARTALFNWLYTKKNKGKMVLRIEDTDRERSTQEAVDIILEGMQWLNLDWDEGPYYQTQRFDRYEVITQQLLDEGKAYHCTCSRERLDEMREAQMQSGLKPRYDQRCRDLNLPANTPDAVIRFRNPNEGAVVFDDLVRGRITVANTELDDLIIARTDGTPTYNLTVVVDDMDMEMTHVLRGDDHINNTPRQINLIHALGAKPPLYAHVPMILGEDGKRLSKRHGAVSVLDYDKMGVLPHALLNYLVRLGWSHGDQEIFSIEEMIDLFDIADVNKAPSTFSIDKLLWVNQHYIKEAKASDLVEDLSQRLVNRNLDVSNGPAVSDVFTMLQERAQTMEEMADQCHYLYSDNIEYEENAAKKHLRPVAKEAMENALIKLSAVPDWRREAIDAALKETLEELDLKLPKLALPLRVAVAGTAATPSIDLTLQMVGKQRVLDRMTTAVSYMQARLEA